MICNWENHFICILKPSPHLSLAPIYVVTKRYETYSSLIFLPMFLSEFLYYNFSHFQFEFAVSAWKWLCFPSLSYLLFFQVFSSVSKNFEYVSYYWLSYSFKHHSFLYLLHSYIFSKLEAGLGACFLVVPAEESDSPSLCPCVSTLQLLPHFNPSKFRSASFLALSNHFWPSLEAYPWSPQRIQLCK